MRENIIHFVCQTETLFVICSIMSINSNEKYKKSPSAKVNWASKANQHVFFTDPTDTNFMNNQDKLKSDSFFQLVQFHNYLKIFVYNHNNNYFNSSVDHCRKGCVFFIWQTIFHQKHKKKGGVTAFACCFNSVAAVTFHIFHQFHHSQVFDHKNIIKAFLASEHFPIQSHIHSYMFTYAFCDLQCAFFFCSRPFQ